MRSPARSRGGPRSSLGSWMAVIVIVVPTLVGFIAMPALGALLIVAGASSLKPSEVAALRNAGWPSVMAGATTYLATLFLPIQVAVGLGVVLSTLLFLSRTASAVTIVQLVKHDDGRIEERTAPRQLPSGAVIVLDVYGELFYAGARTFERLLPTCSRVRSCGRRAAVTRTTHAGCDADRCAQPVCQRARTDERPTVSRRCE